MTLSQQIGIVSETDKELKEIVIQSGCAIVILLLGIVASSIV